MYMWIWLLLLNLFPFGIASLSESADAALPKGGVDRAVSTTITSKRMTVKNQDSQAIFEGAVAVKGAVPSKGPDVVPAVSNRSVNRIEATGRVKIEKDSGNATCEKAIYYHDGDKIVLTGDPVAWDKGTRVSGRQITMFLAEDRSVVEGGSHVRIESDGGAIK
jgi:lipopolysaccharide export system protein LptA